MSDNRLLKKRIQVFRNVVAADPENELANFSLGKLLLEAGELDEAEKALRKSLEINPHLSRAMETLGELLFRVGRRAEATELLRHGVAIAHRRGEFQLRNRMQELLRGVGITPPEPTAKSGAGAVSPRRDSAWTCRHCEREGPRLEEPPLGGAIGREIAARICVTCWNEWKKKVSLRVIKELRLDLSLEDGARSLDGALREFLRLNHETETTPEV